MDALRFARVATFVLLCVCPSAAAAQAGPGEPTLLDELSVPLLDFTASNPIAWAGADSVLVIDHDLTRAALVALGSGAARFLGAEGDGPGELRAPGAVARHGDPPAVLVVDGVGMRLTEWDADGAVRTVPLPPFPLAAYPVAGDSVLVVWAGAGVQGAMMGVVSLDDGGVAGPTSLYRAVPSLAEPGPGQLHPPPPLVPSASCGDGTWVVGNGWTYALARVTRTGEVLGEFGRRELPPEMPTERDLARFDEGAARAIERMPPERHALLRDAMAAQRNRPKPHFGPGSLAGARGRIYVTTTHGPGDATLVDVFDCDGAYLGELRLRDQVIGLAVEGGRLAAVVMRLEDPFERTGIDVYSLDYPSFENR